MYDDTTELRRAIEKLAGEFSLSVRAIDALVRAAAEPATRRRGAGFMQDGASGSHIHIVTAGFVRLEYRPANPKHGLIADIFKAGELLWAPPTAGLCGWTTTYRAHTSDTAVTRIERTVFDHIVARDGATSGLIRSLEAATRRSAGRTLLLVTTLEEAFRAAFVILAHKFGVPHEGGTLLDLPLTHTEWGKFVGCTRENASRHLEHLEENDRVLRLADRRYALRATAFEPMEPKRTSAHIHLPVSPRGILSPHAGKRATPLPQPPEPELALSRG